MRKIVPSLISFSLVLFVLFFLSPSRAFSQNYPYVVEKFESEITLNRDSSLTIEETISVNFAEQRHGIYRTIPVKYRTEGKTINTRLKVLSVTDEGLRKIKYETSSEGDSVVIKIGDAAKYVSGRNIYVIRYRVRNIVQRFEEFDEIYLNVAGAGWDAPVYLASASFVSDFADITQVQCFSGDVGESEAKCDFKPHLKNFASFASNIPLGQGKDMTIVVGVDKNNSLTFKRSFGDFVSDTWGYPLAFIPFLGIVFFWYKKGRDLKHAGDNVYYEPEGKGKSEINVPVFAKREFLPMVYYPLQGLTPSEAGVIIDEKADIHDVVAEIMELGRLGELKIESIKKSFLGNDYLFTRLEGKGKLKDHQKYLLDSIFSFADGKGRVKLSELKEKFHTKLSTFRDKLYELMQKEGYFEGRPDKTRAFWMGTAAIVSIVGFFVLISFAASTGDYLPFVVFLFLCIPSFLFAYRMPRKKPKGYSLFRQIRGLAYYISKGKWRHEINEKHLFLEEMLPLAISLGVVKKLASDMQKLGVKPPSYLNTHSAHFAGSFSSFNKSAGSALVAGVRSSGSWSGGSGFSGGSSGGGFGGGGGGSW